MKLGLAVAAVVLAAAIPVAAQSVPIDHNAIRASCDKGGWMSDKGSELASATGMMR